MPKTYTCRDGNAGFLLGQSPLPSPPPLREYMMPRDAEIALARSAAPANISDRATIKVLTPSGYRVVHEGNNGFVCMVMRGWTAPTHTPAQLRGLVYDASIHAPICFNPEAARTVVPYYELRSQLGMEGKGPDQIAAGVQAAPPVNQRQFSVTIVSGRQLASASVSRRWHHFGTTSLGQSGFHNPSCLGIMAV